MMKVLRAWFERTFADPQAVILALFLLIGTLLILFLGQMLMPVLAALVLAYMLEGVVKRMERRGLSRIFAVIMVYLGFILLVIATILGLMPLLWVQLVDLLRETPNYITRFQETMLQLPHHYPIISEGQIRELMSILRNEITNFGQRILALSLTSIVSILTLMVYLILVPLLLFFFLKDKPQLISWLSALLPQDRRLTSHVWHEVDRQIGNYIRGKVWEIAIVGLVSAIAFSLMGLKYALLLGVLVGLSVIIPYIGAVVVTLPVAAVALFQWGPGPQFGWLMAIYLIIQALDGNVLVPLLFSEVVDLHPIAIIVAVLFFGGLWGFWGVFFAIPLATLVNAILRAWPRPGLAPESLIPGQDNH
jgi:putative permease